MKLVHVKDENTDMVTSVVDSAVRLPEFKPWLYQLTVWLLFTPLFPYLKELE